MADAFIFPALCVLMGLGCFAWTGLQALKAARARRWATTTATIRAHEVESFKEERDTLYEPEALKLRYLYEVDGRLYSSDRLFFGDHVVKVNASYYAGHLGAGDRVTIRYNPGDPSEAVIETRRHPALDRVMRAGYGCLLAAPFAYAYELASARGGGLSFGTMVGITVVLLVTTWMIKRS